MIIKKEKILIFYALSVLILSIFLVDKNVIDNLLYGMDMQLFYVAVSINKSTIVLFISGITFLVIMLFNKKISIDIILIFLLIRLVMSLIPLMYSVSDQFWGSYITQVIDLLVYMIARNTLLSKCGEDRLLSLVRIAAIIVCIQVVLTFLSIIEVLPYLNISYKSLMIIPYGGSNYISTFLVPFLFAYQFSSYDGKKKIDVIIISFIILTIILTKSRFGILMVIIYSIFILFTLNKKVFNKNNEKFKVLLLFMNVIFVYFIFMFFSKYSNSFYEIMIGFSNTVNDGGLLNKLSSGRINIITQYFDKIMSSPLWGHGPAYEFGEKRAHNLLIDIFYQSGVIGFAFLIISFVFWIRLVKKNLNDKFIAFSYYFCIIMIINSMFEISIFTAFSSDFLFFTFLGLSTAKASYLNKLNQ
ncbi:O-antigen ligase [Acetobacterium sp.]|uniref:O-antigen ligase family protein n=1 Tax=Acetobacterium sp. TaxID=1872094 RepID=UPI00271B44BE|nr:O-antigen ligase family protein [Acetobacterium sp.]MDO9493753.1 O-antigen ligase family protein [Acetobacterium sp.]